MDYQIVPVALEHAAGFNAALDRVAREGKYLSVYEGPTPESTEKFVAANVAKDAAQFMALAGSGIVGWCDILPLGDRPAISHIGVLGMGIVDEHRGKGLGRALLERTIAKAREKGLLRIELSVLEGNDRARALYKKFGFSDEGFSPKAQRDMDGTFRGVYTMGLIF